MRITDYIFAIIELCAGLFAIAVFLQNFATVMGTATSQQLTELGISLLAILIIFGGFKRENRMLNKIDEYEMEKEKELYK